jgi:diketogulonate reductase-like aldo/keto reductase
MHARSFGAGGPQVAVYGIGTWNMERDEPRGAIHAIQRAIDLGMTHVDTAELYGSGRVEKMTGEAIAGRRDKIFLVSKVMPRNASFDGTMRACEASLERLGTDHLDSYLLHWRESLPLEDTFAAFEKLREQGKIKSWGVSNFDADDLVEAYAIAGPGKIACNQVLYHLGERAIEHAVIPWCERHGVAVVAYSPLGSRGGFPTNRSLIDVALRLGATPRQVALAFLTRRPSTFAIPKSSHVPHVDELAGAAKLELDDAAIETLEVTFPRGDDRGLPML